MLEGLRRQCKQEELTKTVSLCELARKNLAVYTLYGSSMFAVKAKIYGLTIISPALSPLTKLLVTIQRQKAPNFLAFYWSPHGCQVSIGQHFVTTRSTFTEKDRNKLNYRIGQKRT